MSFPLPEMSITCARERRARVQTRDLRGPSLGSWYAWCAPLTNFTHWGTRSRMDAHAYLYFVRARPLRLLTPSKIHNSESYTHELRVRCIRTFVVLVLHSVQCSSHYLHMHVNGLAQVVNLDSLFRARSLIISTCGHNSPLEPLINELLLLLRKHRRRCVRLHPWIVSPGAVRASSRSGCDTQILSLQRGPQSRDVHVQLHSK